MRWGRTEIEILHHLPFKWATPTLAQATEVLWKPAMRCATWISRLGKNVAFRCKDCS